MTMSHQEYVRTSIIYFFLSVFDEPYNKIDALDDLMTCSEKHSLMAIDTMSCTIKTEH